MEAFVVDKFTHVVISWLQNQVLLYSTFVEFVMSIENVIVDAKLSHKILFNKIKQQQKNFFFNWVFIWYTFEHQRTK